MLEQNVLLNFTQKDKKVNAYTIFHKLALIAYAQKGKNSCMIPF